MLGVNQNVRNVPVSSSTTNDHSAISPSMKDQWSGKTLRAKTFVSVPSFNRSSAHPAAAPALFGFLGVAAVPRLVSAILLVSRDMSASLPETRPDGLVEVASCYQVSLVVHGDLQLGQRPGG